MDEQKPYKERLKNLLDNVHSVKIHNSQDNSWIFIEKVHNLSSSDTDESSNSSDSDNEQRSGEESKNRLRAPGAHPHSRSIASVNGENEANNDKHSLMMPKYQNKIIKKLEKILEERKQRGESGDRSPYRVKLTALDNSWVMFAFNSHTPMRKQNKPNTPSFLEKSSPIYENCSSQEEEKEMCRNRSFSSVQITQKLWSPSTELSS